MRERKVSMIRYPLWVGLFISLKVTGNALDHATANPRLPGRFDFPPSKLQELKKSALEGDKDAALQVAYFELFARSEYRDENIYWEQIAAENGDLRGLQGPHVPARRCRVRQGRRPRRRAG